MSFVLNPELIQSTTHKVQPFIVKTAYIVMLTYNSCVFSSPVLTYVPRQFHPYSCPFVQMNSKLKPLVL